MFKKTIKWVVLLTAIAAPLTAVASNLNPEHNFEYTDTSIISEFLLTNQMSETRYRDEEIDDTCTRQVPYTEEECNNETRYRQVCETIPGYENCSNIEDRECTSVTRYREECHRGESQRICERGPDRTECEMGPSREECTRGPDRQECHRTSSRRECSRGPSRQECSNQPSREVCRNVGGDPVCTTSRSGRRICRQGPTRRVCETVPGRRVCRTVPGERTCRTVPGRRICRSVPGEMECSTIPGRRICEQVPYEDEECRNVTRRVCEWIPSGESCTDVPYNEWVCSDVIRHREESYACTRTIQVPYTFIKNLKALINLDFISELENPKAKFNVTLNKNGKIVLKAKDLCERESIILATKQIDPIVDDENLSNVKAFFKLSFIDKELTQKVLNRKIKNFELTKEQMSFTLGKINNPYILDIRLQVIKDHEQVVFNRVLERNEYELKNLEKRASFNMNLENIEMGNFEGNYEVKVTLELNLSGEIVNTTPVNLKREQSFKKEFERDISEPVIVNDGLVKKLQITDPLKAFPEMPARYATSGKKSVKKYIQDVMKNALADFSSNPRIEISNIKIYVKKNIVSIILDFEERINNVLLLETLAQADIDAELL